MRRLLISAFVFVSGCASQSPCLSLSECQSLEKVAREKCNHLDDGSNNPYKNTSYQNCYDSYFNEPSKTAPIALPSKGFFERWADNIRENNRKAELQKQREQQAKAKAYKNNLLSQCRGYGFKDGTTAFSNCLMQLDQANKQLEQAKLERQRLEAKCNYAEAQGWLAPTRTGNFFEGAQNAAAYRNNCLAGLPPPKNSVTCNASRNGQTITCFAQ